MFVIAAFFLFALVRSVNAQIPCDDAYGEYCPDKAGLDVGTCLKALGEDKLSPACKSYIELHDTCSADIEAHCLGKEYTGDLLVCLTEWTKPDLISETCKTALPKKEEKKERTMTKEERKKADARRKVRNTAAKKARKHEL